MHGLVALQKIIVPSANYRHWIWSVIPCVPILLMKFAEVVVCKILARVSAIKRKSSGEIGLPCFRPFLSRNYFPIELLINKAEPRKQEGSSPNQSTSCQNLCDEEVQEKVLRNTIKCLLEINFTKNS